MKFTSIAPGVGEINEFMTLEACSEFLAQFSVKHEWVQAPIGKYQNDQLDASKVDVELRDVMVLNLENLIACPLEPHSQVIDAINLFFSCDVKRISRSMISKYSVGSHIRPHKDTGVFTTSRLVTLVLYLDGSYKGGEIYFPQLNFQIKPSAGTLFCFYSELSHGVKPITSGLRHSIVAFGENDLAHRLF